MSGTDDILVADNSVEMSYREPGLMVGGGFPYPLIHSSSNKLQNQLPTPLLLRRTQRHRHWGSPVLAFLKSWSSCSVYELTPVVSHFQ